MSVASYEELKRQAREEQKRKSNGSSGSMTSGGTQGSSYEELKSQARNERFEADAKKVDDSYIDIFVNEANKFRSSSQSEYEKISWSNASDVAANRRKAQEDLDYRYNVISRWLENNRSNLREDSYRSLSDLLDSYSNDSKAILDSFDQAAKYYSQWETEEDYNTAVRYDGYNKKWSGQKYNDIQKALSTLEDGEEKDWLSYYQYDLYQKDKEYQSKSLSGLKSYEAQKVAEAEADQNKTWWERMAENYTYSSPDTSLPGAMINQQIANYRNDTSYREMNDDWSEAQKKQFGYLYAEDPNKAYAYAEQVNNQINAELKYNQQQATGEQATSGFLKGAGYTAGAVLSAPLGLGLADYIDNLAEFAGRGTVTQKGYLTPNEYLTAGQSAIADKFNGVDENGVAQNVFDEDLWLIGGKGWGDVYNLGVSGAQSMATGKFFGSLAKAGGMTGKVAEYFTKAGTITSFMGSGAASGIDDVLSRGGTPEQALLYGTIVGAAEGITEMMGIDSLMKVGSSATLKNYFKKALGQGISEAWEEGLSSVIGNVADNWIMKDKSNFYATVKELMKNNPRMTEEQAKKKAWREMFEGVAFDSLGGFVTGTANASIEGVVQTAWNSRKGNEANIKAVEKYGDKTDALIQEGLESDKKSDSYKLAQKYQKQVQGKDGKGGKAMTGAQIRNLLAANQDQITVKDKQNIQKAVENRLVKLGQKEDVSKLAELVTKYVTGQEMTRAEKSTLVRSEKGMQAASEALPKNIIQGDESGIGNDRLMRKWENDMSDMSDDYSTEWAEDIGTKSVNFEAYNKKNIDKVRMVRAALEELASMEGPNAYKSLEERVGTESRYNVSKDGQDTVIESGKAIDLRKAKVLNFIKDKETGKVVDMVIEADGEEVNASGIAYADDNKSYLFEAVGNIENITPEDATVVIRDYDPASGLTVGEYLNGIDEGFTYGYSGYSAEDLKAGIFAPKLSEAQANSAYVLGQNAKKASGKNAVEGYKQMRTAAQAAAEKAAAEGKEAPKGKKLTITYNRGGGVIDVVTNAKDLGELNEEQRGGFEAAKILHQMGIGTDFEFFTSYMSKDENGNPIEVFLNDEGVEEAAYAGVYMSGGKIRINLNAYSGTKGLTLTALSHELTHFIKVWSLDKYMAMAEFLAKSYGEKGKSLHDLVLKEQTRLEGIRKKEVSYDEAYDEVVANAFNRMLDDGKVMEKIAEIRKVDKSLGDKILECIRKFINRFLKVYQDTENQFKETEALMEMKEVFEQLQTMFAEALVDASDNFQASIIAKEAGLEVMPVEDGTYYSYSSLAEAAGFNAVENADGTRSFVRDGNKVNEVTIADIENSPIGAFINFSVEMKDITEDDAKRQKEMFAKICTMACKTNDFAMTMQFVGSAVFTGMKANADKQYGTTYDFPSICTKTQAVIDAMSAKMVSLGRGLTTDEIVKLYDDVFASGNPVPCPECYVFSRWIGIGGLLDNIKKYQDYYGDMDVKDVADAYLKMKAEVSKFADEQGISFGKAKGALTSKLTKEFNKLTEKLEKAENQGEKVKPADRIRLAELEPMMNTVKAMTWLENVYFADSSLKKVNPKFRVPNEVLFDLNNGEAFASQYKDAWAFRTTQGAGYGKAITPYAEARLGEGVLVTNNTTNAIKGRAQGTLNNYFLNQKGKLDKQSRDALKRARMKQKIQAFIGGQRFQSTSDARYENASDYLLAALEMQAMGGMVQCYTKVDGAVPAFAAWGFSINQSLMPLNGGLDADGNVKDTAVGGMKPSVAFDNRDKHETAGTITIGVNDNHIREMFKQWVRDFIIPYHASGGKADVVAEFRRIQEGNEAKGKAVRSTDYSRTQSDKVLSDDVLRWQGKTDAQIQRIHEIRNARIAILTGGKPNMTVVRSNRFLSALYDKLNGGEWDGVKVAKSKVESQIFPNEFWDQTVSYEDSAKITKDYLEYCDDLGFLHRFSGTVPSNGRLVAVNGYNENGERVQLTDLAYKYDENGNKTDEVEPFFWKVLTDRRMYDNNGNYLPQKVVTLNDTTAETVTDFAKHNQGRQYDKAKAEALAKKIVNENDAGLDEEKSAVYDSIGFNDIKYVIKNGTGIKWNNGNTIKLEKDEYAAVVSRISTGYHSMANHGGVQCVERSTDGKDAKFFLYLFMDHGFGDYDIIARLDYANQDELIDELRRMIQNGRQTKRVPASTSRLRSFYANSVSGGRGNSNGSIQNANNQKNTGSRGQRSGNNGQPSSANSGKSNGAGNGAGGVKRQYSSQQTDNITNRHMLANAFEGLSQSSVEYKMIQDYRDHIKQLNELETKLSGLNHEIRKIRFSEGARDTEKLRQLESDAKDVAKEINRYDKRLLNMEASEPLRKVIDRERKKEAQKTREHVKEIQQNKKLRAEQTELRHKVRKAVRDLDKILKHGNKKQNVKEDMKGFASKALELADYLFTDHISNDELIRKGIDADLVTASGKAQLVRETEEIIAKLDAAIDITNADSAAKLTDEEFMMLDAKRKENEAKLKDLLTAQRNRRLNTPVYNLFNDLVTEYANLKNAKQDVVKAAYNEVLEQSLRAFMDNDERVNILKNMRVADMTKEELEWLLRAYKMVLHSIRNANKLFVKSKAESIEKMASAIFNDFDGRKIPEKDIAIVAKKLKNAIGWNYEKLYYALDRIGSEAFAELFMNLANSENIVMQDVMEAAAFRDEMVEKYGFNNWDINKEIDREFLDNTGKKFKLTLGQLMALYAYSRRKGALKNIEYGGFVFKETALTNPKPADTYKLNEEQCEAITNTLTAKQKGYVEEMQTFLSKVMGGKGNEVSMMLYGVEMFNEENYFPVRISGDFKAQAQESQAKAAAGFQSMSNAGFTHEKNPNAKAPFLLDGFSETWVDHVNEMSRYHGTVPALEDIRRVMNRSFYSDSVADSTSIKAAMRNAFGDEAVTYFDNLYREANSGAITDKLQKPGKKLVSMFRKNAVAYSTSVLIQQPTSITRAYALIDPKYFGGLPLFRAVPAITRGVSKAVTSKWNKAYSNAYNEMLKYAPGVTMAKEIGGFDTATGGSIRSYLLDSNKSFIQKVKTGTALEKGKAVMDKVDDNFFTNLPNVADKIAWIEIWNACKRETVAKHKDMKPGSDEFLKAVGERFTEVIRATQVYDSIFAKSPMLKSQNNYVQMVVSFMNEPNTVANMAESAVRDFARGDRKNGVKKVTVLIRGIIFTGVLKSLVYAMRDDDEDETYIEKYLEALTGSLMDDFMPLNYIPLLRDVWSLKQGYDVERADMAIVADLMDAIDKVNKYSKTDTTDMTVEQLIELDKKQTEAQWRLAESLASFALLPAKNIRREINAVINTVTTTVSNAGKTTKMSAMDKVLDSIPFMQNATKYDKLYDAITSGDETYVARLKSGYKTAESYQSELRKALRENDPRIQEAATAKISGNIAEYNRIVKGITGENHFDSKTVEKAISSEIDSINEDFKEKDARVKEAAIAWNANNLAEYMRIARQIIGEKRISQDYVVTAIRSVADSLLTDDGETSKNKAKSLFTIEKFTDAVNMGDMATAKAAKTDIIQTAQKNGKTADEAEDSFNSSVRSELKDMFFDGEISENKAVSTLVSFCGTKQDDAEDLISEWKFEKKYGFTYEDRGDAYKKGKISASQLQSILINVGGMKEEEAVWQVKAYDWEKQGYDGVTAASVRDYEKYCVAADVPRDVYLHIKKFHSNTDNDVDKVTGKKISYSAVRKVMAEINAQSITAAQKTAIARSLGWAESTIRKYKLW